MNIINQLTNVTEKYYCEIFAYCKRHVKTDDSAYDVTQNVFLALSEQFATIDQNNVQKWLYITAKHKIADYYRELYRQKENISSSPLSDFNNSIIYDPYEEITEDEISCIIQDLLMSLNSSEKSLFIDRFINKMSYEQLSHKYGISKTTMRKRVSRLYQKTTKNIKILLHIIIFFILFFTHFSHKKF